MKCARQLLSWMMLFLLSIVARVFPQKGVLLVGWKKQMLLHMIGSRLKVSFVIKMSAPTL